MIDFLALDRRQKERILQSVEKLRSEDRREVLSQALGDEEAALRQAAIEQIDRLKLAVLYPNVLWAAREAKNGVREAACRCVLALSSQELRRLVYPELGSVVPALRMFALDLLAERGDLKDLPWLLPLLSDYKIDVREQARRALKRIFERELENCRSRRSPGVSPLEEAPVEPPLRSAAKVLFELADGPDRITATTAGDILIDYGNLVPGTFWREYRSLSLPGREIFTQLVASREGASGVRLLYLGLVCPEERIARPCATLLLRLMHRQGIGLHLEVLKEFKESLLAKLARQMARYELVRDLVHHFDLTPSPLKEVVFDLLEQLDCRDYVPFLESCLKQEDDLLVYRALGLLIPLERRNYVEDFRALLSRDNPEILLAVLEYLRERADPDILPDLGRLLAHEDERVGRAAIETVFQLSRRHLLARYGDLTPQGREEIIKLLHRVDESFVDALFEDIAALSSQEKVHLVNILEILGQESKIQATLLRLSKEPDQRVRATVAKALQIFSEAKQRLELTRTFLQDEDTRVRANAIESLDRVEDGGVLDRLIELTRSSNSRERANAIKKLWEQGYRDFELSLVRMLQEPDEWTRASAVWVLGEMEAPHLVELLEEALEDPGAVVRENAVRALGKQGSIEQVRRLTACLEDPDRRVREAAREVMRHRLNLSYEIP